MEDDTHISKEKEDISERLPLEDSIITDLRNQLILLLKKQLAENVIDERDVRVISLRLGLENGKYYTLIEASKVTNISPEYLRQRQYIVLKKKIKDPMFFKVLERYSHLVKLPRGVKGYLRIVE